MHTTSFAPSEGGGSAKPNRRFFMIRSDLGEIMVYTTHALASYLLQCVIDSGINVSPLGLLEDVTRGRSVSNYKTLERLDMWESHIANPQNGFVLYEIIGDGRFEMQTVCAMLSTQFQRHHVRLVKNGDIKMTFQNGSATLQSPSRS